MDDVCFQHSQRRKRAPLVLFPFGNSYVSCGIVLFVEGDSEIVELRKFVFVEILNDCRHANRLRECPIFGFGQVVGFFCAHNHRRKNGNRPAFDAFYHYVFHYKIYVAFVVPDIAGRLVPWRFFVVRRNVCRFCPALAVVVRAHNPQIAAVSQIVKGFSRLKNSAVRHIFFCANRPSFSPVVRCCDACVFAVDSLCAADFMVSEFVCGDKPAVFACAN